MIKSLYYAAALSLPMITVWFFIDWIELSLFLSASLLLLPWLKSSVRQLFVEQQKKRLLEAQLAAKDYLRVKQEKAERLENYFLDAALNSDMTITPGMLPRAQWQALEILRCIVTENYLHLMSSRIILGQQSIDWKTEIKDLLDNHWYVEFQGSSPLMEAQCIQAVNSYLNYLIDQEDRHRQIQAA